jgi:hypothetical protein
MLVPVTYRKPTSKHRLAIVPGLFGTAYGVNAEGEARFFDYDREAAYAFAGVSSDSVDVRRAKRPGRFQYVTSGAREANPGPNDLCLWVLR